MSKKLDVAPEATNTGIGPNFNYLRTIPALLKVIEFVLTLLAFAFVSSFVDGVKMLTQTSWGRGNFFIFVMVVAFLGTILLFCFYFINIVSKFKGARYLFLVLAFIHFAGSLCVLVCACLVFDDAVLSRRLGLCPVISRRTTTSCGVYEFGGACAFFAFVAILIDGVLHSMKGIQEFRMNDGGAPHNDPDNGVESM